MRTVFALDVLLAGYAGLMLGPAVAFTRWLALAFGGSQGMSGLINSGHYWVFLLGSICMAWCAAHWALPLPALVLAIGVRLKRTWAPKLGILVGIFLLLLPPLGTLVGLRALVWAVKEL